MGSSSMQTTRIVSVIAATIISLACGTNYVYSAWAPEFAAKLGLSKTEINLIGVFANLGMYVSGIPVGLLVDSRGPRPGTILGSIMLGVGYFFQYRAYDSGKGAIGVPWLCVSSFLTGAGSCAAFAGSIKTSALNWPDHRGSATAFPLAAFGLSAFFFATISSWAFPNNTSDFLLLLSTGTFCMVFVSSFALHVVPQPAGYSAITPRRRSASNPLHRTKSGDSKHSNKQDLPEPGRLLSASRTPMFSSQYGEAKAEPLKHDESSKVPNADTDEPSETSSLMSKSSSNASIPGDDDYHDRSTKAKATNHDSPHVDIRGLALLRRIEFWQLFIMLGLLCGIGLMTINNIGNDAQALWSHYDDSAKPGFIQQQQLIHVSILSVCSFLGRLTSGVGSDLIVKKLHASRLWCLFLSSLLFGLAQLTALNIEQPHLLSLLSALTGLAYGFLFGVYPSLVASKFGIAGLSQNWGFITLAPVPFGQLFNLLYGRIYDAHSTIDGDGARDCPDGRFCYAGAYWLTFAASVLGVGLSLWSIRWESVRSRSWAMKQVGRERQA